LASASFWASKPLFVFTELGQPHAQNKTQPAGPGFDFNVCSTREVDRHLRNPPYLIALGQSFSGSLAETLVITALPPAYPQVLIPHRDNII